jgi:quinol monooxygenase YgiN
MAELPWKSFRQAVPEREYVAMLTYLPLRSLWNVPQFFYYTGRIQSQLKSAPGLIGYSLLAHVREKRFWTLSVWENDAALERFVGQQPHRQAMLGLRRAMGRHCVCALETQGRGGPPQLA